MAERYYHPLFKHSVPTMGRIFEALCAHPYGLTNREICDYVYADDQDGGPDNAWNSINVTICRFNQRAKRDKLGVRILTRTSRGTIGHGHRHYVFIVKEK